MNSRHFIFSIVYSLGQVTLGLLLHPYQTMQMLVRDKVFIWMVLLPSGVVSIVTVIWRHVVVPLVRLFFSCQTTHFFGCSVLPFLSNWLTFFCVYWQLLLLYLLLRFSLAFSRRERVAP